ncbi:uncharacterized protein LOC134272488 [Saccostrea cucullata]|uniref:uncharacterized protein LOC134272488 n=1 Tax=Saccostrea cuccullata TaxID=36930 RepID=UPI002ED4C01C
MENDIPVLFITSTVGVALGGIFIPEDFLFPTVDDFSDSENLTSWIEDTEAKFLLENYLLLCPEQDMCLGPKFRRNYTFILHPSYFIEYMSIEEGKERGPPLSCLEPLWNKDTGIRLGKSYWMVDTCQSGATCLSPKSRNITNATPVTSLLTNETYLNIQCSLCNNESILDMVPWETEKICMNRSALFSNDKFETLYKSVFSINRSVCNIGFHPPKYIQRIINPCVKYTAQIVPTCNKLHRLTEETKAILRDSCQKYYLPYKTSNNIYKNIYCALCEKVVFDLTIQNDVGGAGFITSMLSSFTALMDFKQTENEVNTKDTNCAKNQVFDKEMNMSVLLSSLNREVNVTLSVVGQRFHIHGNSLFVFDMVIVVADWYRCPKVKVKTADAKLNVSHFSVCLVDFQACFFSNQFKEAQDKRSVEICLEQYLKAISQVNSLTEISDDNLMKYFSLTCLSLSSIASLVTILTFYLNKSNRSFADNNIITLAVLSVLANTVYTFSKFFLWNKSLCIGIGMMVHFIWLSVICWMSLSTFQIFQSFTTLSALQKKEGLRVLFFLLVDAVLCLAIVAVNVIVSLFQSEWESLGYSPRTCYIADPNMTLFTFALPVGLFICINSFMFLVTLSRICVKIDIRKSKEKSRLGAYFRLSTLVGVAWLFGFLAQLTELQLFSVLHTLFNGGLGMFIYLAFGLPLNLKSVSRSLVVIERRIRKVLLENK